MTLCDNIQGKMRNIDPIIINPTAMIGGIKK